ncbi:hypothetical protein [Acuticoccus kandeliae]|uniref:hypothetical protein n=1 Tax=Acuticoccus kandeliae TaxID=2073160 RepID=UPI00130043FB|nr:hypothetical protein [Acuticoccus kandeliae]
MEGLLVRMAIWLRRPPSRRFILVAIVVLVAAALLYSIERLGHWPDWLTADRMGRRGPVIHPVPPQ